MKYSSTTRLINTVVFGLIFCIFGAAGLYFGGWVTPEFFCNSVTSSQVGYFSKDYPYMFPALLAVLGIAVAVAALVGLVRSIRSMLHENDDELVVKSFLAYVTIGYILAIFFAINAVYTFDVFSKADIRGWWIAMCVILTIVCLIAANVPLMKILEDDDNSAIASVATMALGISCLSMAFVSGTTWIVTAVKAADLVRTYAKINLAFLAGFTLVAGALALASSILTLKGKALKVSSILGFVSVFVFGCYPIAASSVEYVINEEATSGAARYSLMQKVGSTDWAGLTFMVMGYVVGGVIVLSLIGGIVYSFLKQRKAK